MATTLYLCEKPDQGRIIAKALGGGQPAPGGVVGNGWIVTWAVGHLLTPYMPEDYNEEFKKWAWETLPIVPERFQFKPKDGGANKQIQNIASFMKSANKVVISTDPDREGEMIAYEILNKLKWKGATERLWLADLNLPAVQKSLQNTKDAQTTKPLYWAAMARTYADWIVGMNMSRAATLKIAAYGTKPMSVGRVQSPVLGLIVDMERKIMNFKPQDYFELVAKVQVSKGTLMMRHAPPQEKRILDRAQAETLRQKASGAKGPIEAKTEKKRQGPPSLFHLSTLQQICNGKYGWSADKTLSLTQALYEKHQILTYPRTDSGALPEAHKQDFQTISGHIFSHPNYTHLAGPLKTPEFRNSVYNDKKVTAHHAIVPTHKKADMKALSPDEAKLYDLVVRTWIAAHMPDMQYLQTTITMMANGIPFRASGRQITDPGWKAAFETKGKADDETENDDDSVNETASEDEQDLPPITNGEPAEIKDCKLDAKRTKPPARYTEKTLLQAMENVAKLVDDPKAKQTLKETSGLGTPATRANVIETLKKRAYIVVKKKQLVPTETAFALVDSMRSVAPGYIDPVMTARWEDVLEDIAKGNNLVEKFVAGIAQAVRKDVQAIREANIKRLEGSPKEKPKGPPTEAQKKAFQERLKNATPIQVKFDDREKAKQLGAAWDGDKKSWVIPPGKDHQPFIDAGFLTTQEK